MTPRVVSMKDIGASISDETKSVRSQSLQLASVHHPVQYAMFYVIGLGLADEKDITVRGLEVRCKLHRMAVFADPVSDRL